MKDPAICPACGRKFTGLEPFDAHQDVDYSRRRAVVCKDPATVGLFLGPDDCWGSTDGTARVAAYAARADRLAALRSAGRAQSGEQAP